MNTLAQKALHDLEAYHQVNDQPMICLSPVALKSTLIQLESDARSSAIAQDWESFISHFMDRAECACDNMEGEGGEDFTHYETRMTCAIETLELFGVKYNPITGQRSNVLPSIVKQPNQNHEQ